jgi:hypothetical protein
MSRVLLALLLYVAPLAGQDSTRVFAGQRVRLEPMRGSTPWIGNYVGQRADTVILTSGRGVRLVPISNIRRTALSVRQHRASAQRGLAIGALSGIAFDLFVVGYSAYMDSRATCDPCTPSTMFTVKGDASVFVSIPIVAGAVGLILADRRSPRDVWRVVIPRW